MIIAQYIFDGNRNYTWINLSSGTAQIGQSMTEGLHNWSVGCYLTEILMINESNVSLDQLNVDISNLNASLNQSDLYINQSDLNPNQSNLISYQSNTSSYFSEVNRFNVDITRPNIVLLLPLDFGNLASRNINLSFGITDSIDPEARCILQVDDILYLNNSYPDITGQLNLNMTINYGNHSLNMSCIDHALNIGRLDRGFAITPVNVSFDFSVDKENYFIGEQANLVFMSPVETNLRISIFKDFGLVPIDGFNTTISNRRTTFFRTFADYGYYTVVCSFDHFGYRGTITRNFTVRRNDVTVTLLSNVSNARLNEPIRFEAIVERNISGVTLRWDLNNDGVYETLGREAISSFATIGDKTIRLQADDGYNLINKSIDVHIKNVHTVKLVIIDNRTELRVGNVTVVFNNFENLTNVTGELSFVILDGTYPLGISRQGYYSYNRELIISQDTELTIRLENKDRDIAPPEIYLIYPKEGNQINSTRLTAMFKVIDVSKFNCTVFYSEYSNWYQAIAINRTIENNTETAQEIEGTPGNNYWKVECKDSYGNIGISGRVMFNINSGAVDGGTQANDNNDVIAGAGEETNLGTFSKRYLRSLR
jgi:hypothetical protein